MPWRSVPICDECWDEEHPDGPVPVRIRGDAGICYICGELTTGIYVRREVKED